MREGSTRRSARSRSTVRSPRGRVPRGGVDVYLLPAVIGGGLGDIEEVLAAGRRLARAGFRIVLYRRPGRPLPRSVEGPWDWPTPLERRSRIGPASGAALTIAPAWGVSAAPGRSGAYGRGGPWEVEASDIERVYGPDRTLHVSLEEFGRTATSASETRERLREGGVPGRSMTARLRSARAAGEVETFREAFRRFRAFDRPNVLHLFATFRPEPAFAREFPEAVQTGPLWPGRYRGSATRRPPPPVREWVWYASPASAEAIAPAVVRGLAGSRPPVRLFVRSPRTWSPAATAGLVLEAGPVPARAWKRRFAAAELRIVTGSRTLLEAIEQGGPFLYFNGVLATGRRRRRHRPEKIAGVLALGPEAGAGRALRRDLADFARGRRVAEVVGRAARRTDGWARFPSFRASGFRSPFDDAGGLVVAVARALARAPDSATAIVARVRAGSHP